ncbi:FMRF-amide neuropeptides-like [Ischnura elegans]|uniref:FMRF-amide neuropeptides-like n=1 Tax=Ischnura elegans TaxID=197161 RepID=UPI001ED8A6B3|nr:FMRF-amide neuropeptides-like [Ischnura elegans]
MVGVTLTLLLVAVISTAAIATAGVDEVPAQHGGATSTASPINSVPAAVNLTRVERHSPHAIRERSAPPPEGQPGIEQEAPGGEGGAVGAWGQDEEEEEADPLEVEDPEAPKRRTVRNCYRTPYLFTRRSALDKNFMRFGRGGGWDLSPEEDPEEDSGPSSLMRFQRDRNFIRLGRSTGSNNFIRLGRSPPITKYDMEGTPEMEEGGEDEEEGVDQGYENGDGGEEDGGRRESRGSLNNFMRFGRNSASKNFIRLGRSQGDQNSAGASLSTDRASTGPDRRPNNDFSRTERDQLDRNFLRFGRGSATNFMRFGRSPNNNFMRFGRGAGNNFMRFGRGPNNNFMRFGRGAGNNFMRFGRGAGNNFMRFGRSPNNNFMRFGRGPSNNFMRFGRGADNNFMRFGRSPASDLNKNFLRFGRGGSDGEDSDDSLMSRAYRAALDKNFMRFGRSNNKNFIRLGRGPANNFMRFGRGLEVEEEDDNGMSEKKDILDMDEEKIKDAPESGSLSELFSDKPTGKAAEDAPEVSTRSKRSVHEGAEEATGSLFPVSTAEETLKNPYGSPSLVGTSPLSAYLFSPELLLLPSSDSEETGDGRYRRSRNSNFIRFG